MSTISFANWLSITQQHIEKNLDTLLPAADTPLSQAMRYATLGGGKRIRPVLTCATGALVNARVENLLCIGCAVEMIHVYSLVHDDMPCMDNDILRHGKPTCHLKYDESTALLVGDALQSMAFELLSSPMEGIAPAQQLQMVQLLAIASGHTGMAGGQSIDLANTGKQISIAELEYMHCLKTGALIRAAILLGAQAGEPLSAESYNQLDHFAKKIGLVFQIVDDILDIEADTATLGKTTGKDADQDKATYVNLLGLSEAKQFASELYTEALNALGNLNADTKRLKELADYIVIRSY